MKQQQALFGYQLNTPLEGEDDDENKDKGSDSFADRKTVESNHGKDSSKNDKK